MKTISINALIEDKVIETPHATAVIFKDNSITYHELNNKVNQLAHYLKFLGVTFNTPIAICLNRSFEMVIGILGILKAGGAYVPIDPDYPINKINFILEDTQAPILLTQQFILEKLPQTKARTIFFDLDKDIIHSQPICNLDLNYNINDLAYIIYTSGTTGTPKGVMVSHANLINAYLGWKTAYRLSEMVNTHLQMANFTFDVFTGDLVRALCSGGKLVLCEKETLLDPASLYDLMLKTQVNCAEFVPAVLRKLIQYLENTNKRLDFMHVLICGSDSWTIAEYKKFKLFCGSQTRLINSYGMTEATIDSAYYEATTHLLTLDDQNLVPIGRPFLNVEIYVLDENLNQVSVGVVGEIHIGGAGLASGYINQPELTAQKFILNPFNTQFSAQLYKTGDLGRYLSCGNIELLGRIDNQLKIRGYRIEPNAIESILNQHPSIQESIVLNCQNNQYESLTAFLIVKPTALLNYREIKCFLSKYLPTYMVPTTYKIIENFPLTPNGKVDRKELGIIKGLELRPQYIAPQTTIEIELSDIWCKLLGLKKVGIYDNFFDLGGNSFQLSYFLANYGNPYRVKIKISDIIKDPTIANIINLVAEADD